MREKKILILIVSFFFISNAFCQSDSTLLLKKRIAVLEFKNISTTQHIQNSYNYYGYSSSQELSDNITDMLITELVNCGQFIVIERSRINAILREHNLDVSDGLTPQNADTLKSFLVYS